MADHSSLLKQIWRDARPLIEQQLDVAVQIAAFRELAAENGLDWSQIKALLKAEVQDERAGSGNKHIDRVIEKADFATAYADMLGLGSNPAKMNENNFSAERPAHDPETGEITEPVDRAERRKQRLSESMDDNKALSAEALALGLISEEAHAETVRLSDGLARKLGAGVLQDVA